MFQDDMQPQLSAYESHQLTIASQDQRVPRRFSQISSRQGPPH